MRPLFQFSATMQRDPAIEAWMKKHSGELGGIAKYWFEALRNCAADVREILHDGHSTACVLDTAFAYVNAFKAHINIGFFHGAGLPDPGGLLEGNGKFMRHVKIRPESDVDVAALLELIHTAYRDIKKRLKKVNSSTEAGSHKSQSAV